MSLFRLSSARYDSSGSNKYLVLQSSAPNASESLVYIGGGSGDVFASTGTKIYAAANVSTATGTLIVDVDINGVDITGDLDVGGDLDITGSILKTGNLVIGPTGYVLLQSSTAGQNQYYDAGGVFYWRDFDDSSANRMTLDSATGDLGITGDLDVTGDATISGDVLFDTAGGGLTYGEIYAKDSAVDLTLNSAAKVQVTSFTVNGLSNNMTPDHTNDHITVSTAGVYMCNVSTSVSNQAAQAHILDLSVYKNNGATEFANVHSHRGLDGGSESGSITMSGLITLAASDTIELWATTNSGVNRDVRFEDITLSLMKVGG